MRYTALALCLITAAPLAAQDTPDQGVIAEFLQTRLSGAGRSVEIFGFEGALSSKATIERLTIADDTGVWLTAEGLILDWNRGALLRGSVDISDLSATRIEVTRRPITSPDTALPTAEATPFALPDLPVSIEVDRLLINQLSLGADILGQSVLAQLEGTTALTGGAGQATLSLRRLDGKTGTILLNGQYDNATTALSVDLSMSESADGIAANMLGLPDKPSVDFGITATGTLSNLAATIDLDTDGADRVAGTLDLNTDELGTASFAADVIGDISTLVVPEYRPFFGTDTAIVARGTRTASGILSLEQFDITSAQLSLAGAVDLDAEGWPERIDITGRIAGDGPVTLPFGDAITVEGATVEAQFDAALSPDWTAQITATNTNAPTIAIGDLGLTAQGRIAPDASAFDGAITLTAQGIDWRDELVADAVGDSLSGRFDIDFTAGTPLHLRDIALTGPDTTLTGSMTVDTAAQEPKVTLDLTAAAGNLSRFAGVIGQPIAGDADIQLVGQVQPLSGQFDLNLTAAAETLTTGYAQVDAFTIDGADIRGRFTRDTQGSRIEGLRAATGGATLSGDIALTSGDSHAQITADISDLTRVDPSLAGDAALTLTATRQGTGAFDAVLDIVAAQDRAAITAVSTDGENTTLQANVEVAELGRFNGVTGQSLGGQIAAEIIGTFHLTDYIGQFDVTANSRDLKAGIDTLDTLLVGNGRLSATVATGADQLGLRDLTLAFPRLSGSANAAIEGGSGQGSFDLRIADIAVIAPDFSGPLSATGSAQMANDGTIAFDANATGPGGFSVVSAGTVIEGAVALRGSGSAPLGLLNDIVAPRRLGGMARFNLSLDGALALSNLAGQITLDGGTLSAPTLNQSLNDVVANIGLSNGTAQIDATANSAGGGQIALVGGLGLATFDADMRITANRLGLRDPSLYQTTLNADATINGPITGGALIAGQITLNDTEVRVPSSDISTLGTLPDVTHINAESAVLQTLDRAGLLETTAATGGRSRPFALNLTVSAPSRIFVRGRGLDAELGGQLNIGGDTANVITTGQFELIRGRLDILQQRFDLTEGSAIIQGDLIPTLNLAAETETETGTIVTIALTGPADSPEVTFSSSPELPQDEVLAQLLFGRDISSISAIQAIQLANAVNTLAGRGGDGLISDIRRAIDVDDLDITTDDTGNAAVRAGKYIGENVYTDVTVTTDGQTEINLNLDLTDDVTAKGSFGADGETSLGIFFERDY